MRRQRRRIGARKRCAHTIPPPRSSIPPSAAGVKYINGHGDGAESEGQRREVPPRLKRKIRETNGVYKYANVDLVRDPIGELEYVLYVYTHTHIIYEQSR